MKTKCYSVRLKEIREISDKCLLATSFDGSEVLIPKSQFFGRDYDVTKSYAYWISAWILEKKDIQYSSKKEAYFDNLSREMIPTYVFKKHNPKKIEFKNIEPDDTLIR